MAKKKAKKKGSKKSAKKSSKKAPTSKKKKKGKKKGSKKSSGGDIEDELAELEDQWDDAEEMEFGDVPDGRYQASVTGVEVAHSKSSGRLQINVEFTILSGEFRNRKLFEHWGLDTPEGISWAKTYLARMGLTCSMKELADKLEELKGTAVEVNVKTKGDFQNVRPTKEIEAPEEGAAAPDVSDFDPDDGDDDGDEDGDEDVELKKGMMVKFDDDGEEVVGKITKLNEKDETVNIETDDAKYKDVDVSELSLAEDEDGDEDGDDDDDGDGDDDGDDDDGDDDSDGDDDDDDAGFEKGDEVTWGKGKKKKTGKIVSVDEEEEEAVVKVGKKKHTVSFDKLDYVEED